MLAGTTFDPQLQDAYRLLITKVRIDPSNIPTEIYVSMHTIFIVISDRGRNQLGHQENICGS